MANFEFDFDDLFAKQLEGLEDFDGLAIKMLEGASPTLVKNLKESCASHRDTGEMVNSIKATKPKKGKKGITTTVRPTGKDKKGVRNMEKLVYLQYGTSKQTATPVVDKAVKNSASSVAEIMQEIYNREVSK